MHVRRFTARLHDLGSDALAALLVDLGDDDLRAVLGQPARLSQIEFMTFAGGQTGSTLQLEVRVANSVPSFPSGNFQNNMVSGETLVHPQAIGMDRSLTTPATAPGARP